MYRAPHATHGLVGGLDPDTMPILPQVLHEKPVRVTIPGRDGWGVAIGESYGKPPRGAVNLLRRPRWWTHLRPAAGKPPRRTRSPAGCRAAGRIRAGPGRGQGTSSWLTPGEGHRPTIVARPPCPCQG